MEMQLQELPSADMSSTASAASHDPDQLISSKSSSSILSALSSAPLETSSSPSISTSPLTPAAPQQPQLAELQHCTIAILPSAPEIPRRRRRRAYPLTSKEEALRSLKESIPHSMRLSQLLKSEMGFQKDAQSHKKLMRRHSKDLFKVVSIYAVLQGAIFSAVAQSSIFTCTDLWGPVGIVAAVTIGTLCPVFDKLRRMAYEKLEVKHFEKRQNAVFDKIILLYSFGSLCEIEDLEPAHEGVVSNEAGRMYCIFSVHGLFALGFLVSFSALMIMSCLRMLCDRPCRCGH